MDQLLENVETDEEAIELVREKKKQVSDSSVKKIYGLSDKWYIQRYLAPKAQYKYAYVLLDTANLAPEISSNVRFGWNTVNYISQQRGYVTTVSNIRDLVGMRLFPVTMRLQGSINEPGKVLVNPTHNPNNNVTLLIHEFQSQSFVNREGRKFHFCLFPVLMNPLRIRSSPLDAVDVVPPAPYYEFTTNGKNNGWFWFNKPITEFSTMSVSIANPFNYLEIGNVDRILIPIQLIYMSEKS